MAYKDYRDIIRQMEQEMQQLTDEAFRGFFEVPMGGTGSFWQPPIDVHETHDQLLVKMELAGAKADDLQVSLSPDDRILTISGVRGEDQADRAGRVRCHQLEIYVGPFERSIALPETPLLRDKIAATYKDGFLRITLPKKVMPPKPQRRIIPITSGADIVTSGADIAVTPREDAF